MPAAPGDGRALPASMLAAEAGVAPSTASEHLSKLVRAGLLTVERHSRHRYFRLAGMLTGCLRAIVVRGVERGQLPRSTDVELLSQLPLSLLQTWRLEHHHDPDEAVVERIVAQF